MLMEGNLSLGKLRSNYFLLATLSTDRARQAISDVRISSYLI